MTISDCNHLAHVTVLWQIQKFSCMFLLCFILHLRAISKYEPPGAYILRGNFKEGFLPLLVWEGLIKYLEGFIFGILRYQVLF